MCSRWSGCFSWVIVKVKGHFTFIQQTRKVRKKRCAPIMILGIFFGKKKMWSLKNS
jgi:hypothetical protein